ncbi:MAG: MoxR family ATPase [Candidatus Heimdallarchaeota archaeon]|nr:MoxR family ATPase [Candidatus Heimdallarchaeota archaeon]
MSDLSNQFKMAKYLPNEEITTIANLAMKLNKPVLMEGPPGTGKTSLATAIASITNSTLYRIQCYEGITAEQVIGEYNYQKQLIEIAKQEGTDVFSQEFFIARPLLQVLQSDVHTVLLIDEVDRADEEFEAFLLEALGENQITLPELGTIKAKTKHTIILTSNGTRELSGALRRRSLYLSLDYPSKQREIDIVALHVPELQQSIVDRIVAMVRRIRRQNNITQAPSISETIDFARSILILGEEFMQKERVERLLGILAKNTSDLQILENMLLTDELLG